MDVSRILEDCTKGKLLPIYVISGAERLLVARAVEALRKATVGVGPRGLSEEHFEAQEHRAARVVDSAKCLPMMSKWRFILVREINNWKAEDQDSILPYIEHPTPSTLLLLLSEKLDARTRMAKALEKKNYVFVAEPPSEDELIPWLEADAKRRGTSFAPGAAASLALTVGPNLTALSDALDRLHLFAGQRPITEEDVDGTVASLREAELDAIQESIGARETTKSLLLLDNLLRQKKPGLLILTYTATRIRQLILARDAIERSADVGAAIKAGKLWVRNVPAITAQARKWTTPQLSRALKLAAMADLKLKSGGGRDREARVLEELILALDGRPGLGEAAM